MVPILVRTTYVITTLKCCTDYRKNICYFHWTLYERNPFGCIKGK